MRRLDLPAPEVFTLKKHFVLSEASEATAKTTRSVFKISRCAYLHEILKLYEQTTSNLHSNRIPKMECTIEPRFRAQNCLIIQCSKRLLAINRTKIKELRGKGFLGFLVSKFQKIYQMFTSCFQEEIGPMSKIFKI